MTTPAMPDLDKTRAEFEAAMLEIGQSCARLKNGDYVTPANYIWIGWDMATDPDRAQQGATR